MSRARDILRQTGVIASVSFMLVAAVVGVGLLGGTPVQDLQGGALDADASYLAPARPAFSIWSVIYLGLIAYTVWQALPAQRDNPRQRQLGWWIALTAVLNGLWLVAAQYTVLWLTVVVIALLLVALAMLFRRLSASRPDTWVEAGLVDGVTGLHLGWVTAATVANLTALLTAAGPPEWGASADVIGVYVLAVVTVVGAAIGWASGGRFSPALALAWGLVWIGVGRLWDEPSSLPIGIASFVAAFLVLASPALRRVVTYYRVDEGITG